MTKRPVPSFKNDKVRLRLLTAEDLEMTLNWRNQDHIRKWFFHSDIIEIGPHRRWFEQYQERDDDFVFVIESVADNYLPVGQIALYHIDWAARRAEYGRIMIADPAARGKGLGRAATRAILKIGFEYFHLQEIYLEVLENNQSARAVYADCGFKVMAIKDGVVQMNIHPGEVQ
ncbi:MAG TPA: GNAT family N-acetyltransferase [Anaerolineaceae bacterium]|jgi:RimJ/RimL family protein N-acetyltransferase|nr:GNAT family N-acetyltransferase [Anaerolineaceae bacterium]